MRITVEIKCEGEIPMKKIVSLLLTSIMVLGLVGCSSKEENGAAAKNVPTADLVSAVKEKIEVRMTGPVEGELAKTNFHLNLDDAEEYTIEQGMINTGLETLAVVKAKEGKTDGVKKSFEQVVEDKKNGFKYPGEEEAIEKAKIEVIGNYVVLFILPDLEEAGTDNSAEAVNIVKEALK